MTDFGLKNAAFMSRINYSFSLFENFAKDFG